MLVSEVIDFLEQLAPKKLAEDFDNVGLLVGNSFNKVNGILVSLDITEDVLDEAIKNNTNLIVSFHPIIFDGLKTVREDGNYVQKIVVKAIQNNLNIFAIHTSLDNARFGVNDQIGKKLGVKNYKVLIPKENSLLKLTTYIPKEYFDSVKQAIFDAGAGKIGNYDSCSFSHEGIGTFKPMENANPFIGEKNKLFEDSEIKFSVVFSSELEQKVIKSLLENHPYEEVAYEIVHLKNKNQFIGMGGIGELEEEIAPEIFLERIKSIFNIPFIKHTKLLDKKIKKIAFIGGSGSFGIKNAIQQNADIFLTADLKYHNFFEAENKIILADIGHFESEQFTKELIVGYLKEKINKFAILESTTRTNPVYYK